MTRVRNSSKLTNVDLILNPVQKRSLTVKFIKTIHIPEVTEDEYVAQVKDTYGDDVSNAEALELLYADVAIDDHLDSALELE